MPPKIGGTLATFWAVLTLPDWPHLFSPRTGRMILLKCKCDPSCAQWLPCALRRRSKPPPTLLLPRWGPSEGFRHCLYVALTLVTPKVVLSGPLS